ncbi:photosystem II protein PsbQ [Candidatus Synechococcus calcipolaris G9]|uniref:Photosystem II protein PsbQ n=1 Tax=Candidatus Synechococcus calcipolaris G9 TaxID=1497997 RepID=A0ABT6EYH3_9SYNE|nr:photosystem II protein PsbQ [Candidatus Synechococcus calcipolaris]MDG2990838.1 photosystem II protein PsbQ [Candidatus Synechococcus calcipolaris G9]
MTAFRLKNWLPLVLGLIAVVLVSCGAPPAAIQPPPTYTPEQLTRIDDYLMGIEANAQRFAELEQDIATGDWQDVQGIMRGPLGAMLQDMRFLNRNLLPKDQPIATKLTRSLFDHFVDIDQAADSKNTIAAQKGLSAAEQDFELYLKLMPLADAS